jgi:hypothetical protein
MTTGRSFLCVAAVLVCVSGCGDSGTAPDCAGAVNLSVGSGTTPQFRWTPTCRLFLVLVEDPATGDDQWAVDSDSSNAIDSPVTYGTIPKGATKQSQAPVALQAGHTYQVYVFRFTGPGHEDGVLIAQQPFTP